MHSGTNGVNTRSVVSFPPRRSGGVHARDLVGQVGSGSLLRARGESHSLLPIGSASFREHVEAPFERRVEKMYSFATSAPLDVKTLSPVVGSVPRSAIGRPCSSPITRPS